MQRQETVVINQLTEVPTFITAPVFRPLYDQESEVVKVLERAAKDPRFIAELTHNGSQALRSYDLTSEEKAALMSGDIKWIERHVGRLSKRQRKWLDCRLQQEIW